jgi:hypothetical protein
VATITFTATDQDGRIGSLTVNVIGSERERRAAQLGLVKPGPGDVGVYAGVTRTAQAGVTFTPGSVIENKTITGRLSVPAQSGQNNAPVILRNCELIGPTAAPAGGDGILAATGANHVPVILEDCTLHAQATNYFRNGAMGHHFTMRGCDVYDLVDGADIFCSSDPTGPVGVVIEGSWFHDSSYFASNPAGDPDSQTHNDTGIQIMGGSGLRFIGNRVDGFLGNGALNTHGTNRSNACIMIKPDSGTISDLVIRNNWFDGGRVPLNLAQDTNGRVLGDGIVISDNVFGRSADAGPDYSILMPASASSVVATGNVHTDGSPAVVRRNG